MKWMKACCILFAVVLCSFVALKEKTPDNYDQKREIESSQVSQSHIGSITLAFIFKEDAV